MAKFDLEKLKKVLVKQFLPIGFAICVIWAMLWPAPGDWCYMWESPQNWKIISTLNMCIIFFIFGITLETEELKSAARAWKALLLGLTSELFLTALTGFIPVRLPFNPVEFGIGLSVFACVPTSLSSGVVLVIQSYGNGALALMLTVAGNLIGIFTAPIFVKLVLGGDAGSLDTVSLLVKLVVSIFMPLVVGKTLRELFKPTIKFAKKYKVPLYMFNNLQVIMIVWQTLSHSQHKLIEQKLYDIIMAIIAAILQHFFFLILNTIFVWITRIPEAERKAVIVMASQKALPVAVVILNNLGGSAYNPGLMAIPCVVFYVMQLFIDAFITNGWASKYERGIALEEKYRAQLADLDKLEADWEKIIASEKNQQFKQGAVVANMTAEPAHIALSTVNPEDEHEEASLLTTPPS